MTLPVSCTSVPLLTNTLPVKVLRLVKVNVPLPVLVRPPGPAREALKVRALELLAVKEVLVTVPFWRLPAEMVTALTVWVVPAKSTVPPLTVNAPLAAPSVPLPLI